MAFLARFVLWRSRSRPSCPASMSSVCRVFSAAFSHTDILAPNAEESCRLNSSQLFLRPSSEFRKTAQRKIKCRHVFLSRNQSVTLFLLRAALQQLAATRDCCNSFFLEVVSRFCLSEGQSPTEGVVELLFSLLVSANGQGVGGKKVKASN